MPVEWFPREFRNLTQLAKNFEANKIFLNNISRHSKMLVT